MARKLADSSSSSGSAVHKPVRKRRPANASSPKAKAEKRDKRTCILVLGMHRSGTSALTRLISLMGGALPRDLLGSGSGNDAGHWESKRLAVYHGKLLSQLDSVWLDWRPVDWTQIGLFERTLVERDWASIIKKEYGEKPVFVIKEPRICRFSDSFIASLERQGFDVRPTFIFRNPLDVVDSLMARTVVWPPVHGRFDGMLMWLAHNLEAERATRGMPRAVVSYEALIADWRTALGPVTELAGAVLAKKPQEVAGEIDAFLNTELRHHTRSPDEVALDPQVAGWASDCYTALRDLEAGRGEAQAKETLDRIHSEFLAALPYLEISAREKEEIFEQKQRLETESSAQAEKLTAELDGLRSETREHEKVFKQETAAAAEAKQRLEAESSAQAERAVKLTMELERLRRAAGDREKAFELEIKTAEEAKQRYETETSVQAEKAEKLAAELDELRNAISNRENVFQREVKAAVEAKQRYKTESSVQAEKAEKLAAELDELRNAISNRENVFQREIKAAVEAIQRYKTESSVQAERAEKLAAELDELRGAISEREKAFKQETKAAAQARQRLETELDERRQELNVVTGAKQRYEAESSAQTERADKLAAELEQTHGLYRESTSWKLTAPIRRIKSILGPIRGKASRLKE